MFCLYHFVPQHVVCGKPCGMDRGTVDYYMFLDINNKVTYKLGAIVK
jgi:hypothetical protein